MSDYDVIVIGGGINGLTTAAYLARAGLSTLVLEARGECGAHCDTCEPGIPGFLHNLHCTWFITAMAPAMADLDLPGFGLEFRGTNTVYAKTFADGKNAILDMNPMETRDNWARISESDAAMIERAAGYMLPRINEVVDALHSYLFQAPSLASETKFANFMDGFFAEAGYDLSFSALEKMNGFQALDTMMDSEHIKTMIQSLAWISGMPPIHKKVGSIGATCLGPMTGAFIPVHIAYGGSHSVTHALVKAAKTYGAKILPCCPVSRILVEDGKAVGVKLSEHAVYPGEEFRAKKVVSNLTVVPTFIDLVGEDATGAEMAYHIKKFNYNEQNLFGVYYALSGQPEFASADFDDRVQKCFMGYFGGDNTEEMERYAASLVSGRIHDEVIANWFVPTVADPTQAPEGCHTSFVWFDVPPAPTRWREGRLSGMSCWDDIKERLADQADDAYEKYAPGFKSMVRDRIIYTPLDMYRNNPSAVEGNWVGGSVTPDQFYFNRPVPGVLRGGASRTFLENLYLSNSIHPFGTSWLAPGYLAACEVAEDMGARDQDWWQSRACMWYLENLQNIPLNLGVGV
ncbi:MAG: phytoene desaturase family protein [Desulfatibacillaceae bacterium]